MCVIMSSLTSFKLCQNKDKKDQLSWEVEVIPISLFRRSINLDIFKEDCSLQRMAESKGKRSTKARESWG